MPIALLDRARVRPDHATIPGPVMAFSAAMDLIDGVRHEARLEEQRFVAQILADE